MKTIGRRSCYIGEGLGGGPFSSWFPDREETHLPFGSENLMQYVRDPAGKHVPVVTYSGDKISGWMRAAMT